MMKQLLLLSLLYFPHAIHGAAASANTPDQKSKASEQTQSVVATASNATAATVAPTAYEVAYNKLCDDYRKQYEAQIAAAEEKIRQESGISKALWEKAKALMADKFAKSDALIKGVINKPAPLAALRAMWFDKNKLTAHELQTAPKELRWEIWIFDVATKQLYPSNARNKPDSLEAFLHRPPSSIQEFVFLRPDNNIGVAAYSVLANFGLNNVRVAYYDSDTLGAETVATDVIHVSHKTLYHGSLAGTIAHEAQHILFADAERINIISAVCDNLKGAVLDVDQIPAYLELKRLQELRADTFAALKSPEYLSGILSVCDWIETEGYLVRDSHIQPRERKALLNKIRQELAALPQSPTEAQPANTQVATSDKANAKSAK
jgi:hypothetical protein